MTFITLLAALLFGSTALFAQGPADKPSVVWKVTSEPVSGQTYKLTFTGRIEAGKHIYGIETEEGNPTGVDYVTDLTAGELVEASEKRDYRGEPVFFDKVVLTQEVTVEGAETVEGSVYWQACTDEMCSFPEEQEFTVALVEGAGAHQTAIGDPEE